MIKIYLLLLTFISSSSMYIYAADQTPTDRICHIKFTKPTDLGGNQLYVCRYQTGNDIPERVGHIHTVFNRSKSGDCVDLEKFTIVNHVSKNWIESSRDIVAEAYNNIANNELLLNAFCFFGNTLSLANIIYGTFHWGTYEYYMKWFAVTALSSTSIYAIACKKGTYQEMETRTKMCGHYIMGSICSGALLGTFLNYNL